MELTFFDILLLLGILQGMIVGFLLFTSKKNSISNKFMALALLSFCFLTTKPLLHTLSLWDTQWFRYFPNATELLIAPLIYFYVISLISPNFKFHSRYWLHFIPFAISQLYSFWIYFGALGVNDFSAKDAFADSLMFAEVKQLDEYVLVLMTLYYLFEGFRMLKSYKHWIKNNTSESSLPDLSWLINLFILFGITAFILICGRLISALTYFDFIYVGDYYWKFISLYMAFLIYYLGFRAYLQPNFELPIIESSKEKESSMDKIVAVGLVDKIEYFMNEEKLYLDAKLNIQSFSRQSGIPQREVSNIINHELQTNFRDYINGYRVTEVKRKLLNHEHKQISLLGIAMESGFNSEASFYRLFKKETGLTPKEFIALNSSS